MKVVLLRPLHQGGETIEAGTVIERGREEAQALIDIGGAAAVAEAVKPAALKPIDE